MIQTKCCKCGQEYQTNYDVIGCADCGALTAVVDLLPDVIYTIDVKPFKPGDGIQIIMTAGILLKRDKLKSAGSEVKQ